MNTTTVEGEVTTPKKVAFVDRKSANSNRIEQDEKELKELLEEKESANKENTEEVEAQEAEPVNAEEKSFKKRYGDLRRHQQTKEKEYENRIKALEEQLAESTRSEIKLPKSDEDIEAWSKKYPDVAAIVETIAIKKAREEAQGLEDTKKEIEVNGPVTDISYNSGVIVRERNGKHIHTFGEELKGDALIDSYCRSSA